MTMNHLYINVVGALVVAVINKRLSTIQKKGALFLFKLEFCAKIINDFKSNKHK